MNDMRTTIKIEKVNYFGERTNTSDFNAKVLYYKYGKMYLAHIYIDYFNRRVYEGSNNPKEHKALSGFMQAINEYANKTRWMFQ
jgi:hypothetical protein